MNNETARIVLAACMQNKNLSVPKPCVTCGRTDRPRTLRGVVGKVPGGTKAFGFFLCNKCPEPSNERLEDLEKSGSGDIYVLFLEGNLDSHMPKLISQIDFGKVKFR